MPATIVNLDRYGLSLSELRRFLNTAVTYSINLEGPDIRQLSVHGPSERRETLRAHLQESSRTLTARFEFERFSPRDSQTPWTIDAVSTALVFCSLERYPLVKILFVERIKGRRRVRERTRLSWFSVLARVAIQAEGQTRGLQGVEDRIVMVCAYGLQDAERRLESEWREYAAPYLNSNGKLVRWKLEEV